MLITGATGEIGKTISSVFTDRGVRLLPVADLSEKKNYPTAPPKRLLHLAGRSDESRADSIIDSNIGYLTSIIQYAEQFGVEEFIFFSSVSVYGNQNKQDLSETDALAAPGLYGLSKLIGEKILENSGLNVLCLRLPGVLEIGKSTNFLSRTFVRLQKNENITVFNADNKFNNFIDIWNLAEFVAKLTVKKKFDVINLGNLNLLTLRDIINLMRNALNSSSKIEYSDKYMPFFNLSIAKAVSYYDFNPGNARDNIIRWCSQRLAAEE